MWAGIVSSGAFDDAEEGTSGACFPFSATRPETSGAPSWAPEEAAEKWSWLGWDGFF